MESTPRWGITLPLRSTALADQRDLVAALPGLGYTDAWSSEVNGADAFTPLAVAAQWTTGLRFGTAIAGIYTRGPALLAMDAATCAGLAPGRFVLGIGTSSPVIVEDWNGLTLDRPYQRARDTLKFLRPALAGEKVSGEFETFTVRGFRLDPPPVQPPGLVLAALRPGMVRLAATLAQMYRDEVDATGQPMSPDPFSAIKNAIEHYRIDDILISTLRGEQSKWLEEGLIEKVKNVTDKPLEHVESGTEPASATTAATDTGAESTAVGGAA